MIDLDQPGRCCCFPGCTKPMSDATYFCLDCTKLWLTSPQRRRAFGADADYKACVLEFIEDNAGPEAQRSSDSDDGSEREEGSIPSGVVQSDKEPS